jgi:hypothetical protein
MKEMIKLIKEFLITGIDAHRITIEAQSKDIDAANAAIKSHQKSLEASFAHLANTRKVSERHEFMAWCDEKNRELRLELNQSIKRPKAEVKQSIKFDLAAKEYLDNLKK